MQNRREVLFCIAASALFSVTANAQSSSRPTQLIIAARRQIGVTLSYDPAYTRLAFPNGDVPRSVGVCTDVIIRAYRDAFGIDLQLLINEDMKRDFSRYPKRWGLKTTDRNIDHRRVPNLQTFLERRRAKLAVTGNADDWRPGDIVTSLVGGTLPHIGIVSDKRTPSGRRFIIHNIGRGTREEDVLFAYQITGHYRWLAA